jgi:predicted SprT family Zn-dependent metalloprotease
MLRGQRLEISCYYDWQEDALRDVIVHEMIHYYLAVKHIDNNLTHGEEFLKMAKEMNSRHGMNVSVKVDTTGFKRASSAPKLGYYLSLLY